MSRFKDGVEPVSSAGPVVDLFEGGYFEPEDFLADARDVKHVNDSIAVVEQYLQDLEDAELIEEI